MPSPQYKYWCFNSFEEDEPIWHPLVFEGMVFQREKCPETGRLHWQGFVKLKKKSTRFHLKELLGQKTHCDRCVGSYKQNWDYCTKMKTAVGKTYVFGDCPEPEADVYIPPMTVMFRHVSLTGDVSYHRSRWEDYELNYGFPRAISEVIAGSEASGWPPGPRMPEPPEGNALWVPRRQSTEHSPTGSQVSSDSE